MTRVVQMFIKNSVVDPDPYWILIQNFVDLNPFLEFGSGSTLGKIG